jgi:predicted PolB exonuclease-like 3'-5' exonuclease
MAHYLVFDIETRVDKELVKAVYDPENVLTLEQAYDSARDRILEASNQRSDFFPLPFHVPIAIAMLQVEADYRIRSLSCSGVDRSSEAELVGRFWQAFEGCQTLVTFNGRGFDLPVLELRALKHSLALPR